MDMLCSGRAGLLLFYPFFFFFLPTFKPACKSFNLIHYWFNSLDLKEGRAETATANNAAVTCLHGIIFINVKIKVFHLYVIYSSNYFKRMPLFLWWFPLVLSPVHQFYAHYLSLIDLIDI